MATRSKNNKRTRRTEVFPLPQNFLKATFFLNLRVKVKAKPKPKQELQENKQQKQRHSAAQRARVC